MPEQRTVRHDVGVQVELLCHVNGEFFHSVMAVVSEVLDAGVRTSNSSEECHVGCDVLEEHGVCFLCGVSRG